MPTIGIGLPEYFPARAYSWVRLPISIGLPEYVLARPIQRYWSTCVYPCFVGPIRYTYPPVSIYLGILMLGRTHRYRFT